MWLILIVAAIACLMNAERVGQAIETAEDKLGIEIFKGPGVT